MRTARLLFLSLGLTLLLGCDLPDNDDHSHCAPDQDGVIAASPARAFVTDAEGTVGEWVPYSVSQGRAILEADILLGDAGTIESERAIVTTGRTWRNGVVPYRFHKKFKNASRVLKAMKDWEDKTGGLIRFVPATTQADYAEFVPAEGCWSYVGRTGGRQEVGLSGLCGTREAKHEIGHLLGLWHEQSRIDRDAHVEVKWCNIEEKHRHNFFRRVSLGRDSGPYDFKSIMHYPRGAFSNNGKITLKPRGEGRISHWNRRRISDGDVAAIRELYAP